MKILNNNTLELIEGGISVDRAAVADLATGYCNGILGGAVALSTAGAFGFVFAASNPIALGILIGSAAACGAFGGFF